jgi:hypothetical protein
MLVRSREKIQIPLGHEVSLQCWNVVVDWSIIFLLLRASPVSSALDGSRQKLW